MLDYLNFPMEVMLAESMNKPIEHYLGWRIQEKTDGIRALIVKKDGKVAVFGRNQTKAGRADFTKSLPEIADFFADVDNFIIDCELMSKDFLTLQTKVRTKKTIIHDPYFYIKAFDIIEYNGINALEMEVTHDDRYQLLSDFISQFGEQKFLKLIVQSSEPLTEAYLNQCLDKIVAKGGEGLILRDPNGLYYPGKRRSAWTKVLPHRVMDVLFIGKVKGEGKYFNTLGALEAFSVVDSIIKEDIKFHVGTGFSDQLRSEIWEKIHQIPQFFPIPGKIKYKDLYPTGKPRMPVFLSFNVDKEIE